jgi:uncharacterized protein (TIGR01244 family)
VAGLDGIYNFLPLSERLATAGQPTADELAGVGAAGYEVLINLLPSDSPSALPDEAEIVARLGLEYVALPVDWQHPRPADAERFFDVLDANAGRRVFAHCAANMRVSAFVSLYRVLRQGMAPAEAQRDLHRIWTPNATWQRLMEEVSRHHEGSAHAVEDR